MVVNTKEGKRALVYVGNRRRYSLARSASIVNVDPLRVVWDARCCGSGAVAGEFPCQHRETRFAVLVS